MSAIFQNYRSRSYLDLYDGVNTAQSSFTENLKAGFEDQIARGNSNSRATMLEDAWQPFIDEIKDKTGEDLFNPGKHLNKGIFSGGATRGSNQFEYLNQVNKIIDFAKNNTETLGPEFEQLNHDFIMDRAIRLAKDRAEEFDQVAERSGDWKNFLGRFGGAVGGSLNDPVIQGTMFLGFSWRIPQTLYGLAFREALVGGATEVLIQAEVADWYKTLELPYTFDTFVTNVAASAALSAAFPLSFRVGKEVVKLSGSQAKKGYEAIKKASEKLGLQVNRNADTAAEIADTIENTIANNPLASVDEHLSRVDAMDDGIENGELPRMNNEPASDIKPSYLERIANPGKDRETISDIEFRFEIDELNVDAKSFQFKAGTDEFGVGEKLQGITEWNPLFSGKIVAYEQADGSLFIADGHQRLGLAKRIKKQDPSQEIFLTGHLLREKDGVTKNQAVVMAAVKNITEETGTTLDAVKILRGDPKQFEKLPPRSAFVRDARNIVNIKDDEAYGLFVNDIVSSNQASVVGRMIPEDAVMQRAAMNVIAKLKPESVFQTESIVRQVMDSGTQKIEQESLFGDKIVEESLFFERAKVLENAVKILQRDKSAFNTIVRNQTKFESAGNKLIRSANEQKIEKDAEAINLIQTLANRKGQLSEDLTNAARLAKRDGKFGTATDSFVESVRGAVDRGDFSGEIPSVPGRGINDPPQNGEIPSSTIQKNVDDFDEPAGPGSLQQMEQLGADMFQEPPVRTERESFQSSNELRNDLGRIIEEGADEATIDAHPAVTQAIEEARAIPDTSDPKVNPGYNTEPFENSRIFNTKSLQKLDVDVEDQIVGYTDAIAALYKGARNMAWRDDGLELPIGQYINQNKRAAIVLGPPASGKSTLANPIARKMNAAVIDSDEVKKIMPEHQGGIGANAVHQESKNIAERVLNVSIELGDNVVIPKVGGEEESIANLIKKLKDKGYSVDLVDMSVTYSEARKRMYLRFVKEGKLIFPDYVRDIGNKPGQTYDALKAKGAADGYTRIDNNGEIDEGKVLIEDTREIIKDTDIRLRRSGEARDPGSRLTESEAPGIRGNQEVADAQLDYEVPIGQITDPVTGEISVVNQTMRQIKEEVDYEDSMIERMGYCVK